MHIAWLKLKILAHPKSIISPAIVVVSLQYRANHAIFQAAVSCSLCQLFLFRKINRIQGAGDRTPVYIGDVRVDFRRFRRVMSEQFLNVP